MLQQTVQQTVIDFVRKGEWLKLDYNQRIGLDAAFLREVHGRVSMEAVIDIVKQDVERRIADGILNAMAQEVANDVKSIMCNKELREDVRSVIRAKIREVKAALSEDPKGTQ